MSNKAISMETAKPVLTLEMICQNIVKMADLAINADDKDVENIAYAVLNMAEDMAHNFRHSS